MEGIIKVTPEELIATSGEFSTSGNEISQLTSSMTSLVVGLSSIWEGEAATAYMTKFKGLEDDIQKMIRMVQEHATDLTEMGQAYQSAENVSVQDISALSSDVII